MLDVVGLSCPPEGVLNKVSYGEAPPQGPAPYPFIYHFGRKGKPFYMLFVEKRYPFHIPTLGSLVLIFMKGLINKLVQP